MRTEEGAILLNTAGDVLWANIAATDLLGFTIRELREISLATADAADGAASNPLATVAPAFRAIRSGQVAYAEGDGRFPDKAGRRIALHWKLWELPPSEGHAQLLLSISEAAQASSEGPVTAGYRDIFEHAIEGIFRSSVEGQFLEINRALAQMYGYSSPAELMNSLQSISRQVYVDPERRREFIRRMHADGYVADFESEARRADGRTIWIAEFARAVRDADGAILYFEGSVIDITERRRANAALKKSEEQFRRLAETTRMVPFEYDPDACAFVYVGPQAEQLCQHAIGAGFSLESWRALVHADDLENGTLFAREAGLRSTRDYQVEFRIRAKEGGIRWVKQIVHCAQDEDVNRHVRGFLFDITEAKELEEEREFSRQQLRDFAARSQQVREEERANIAREIHDELGQALTLFKLDLAWLGGRLARIQSGQVQAPIVEKIASMEKLMDSTLHTVRRILSALRPPLLDELGLKDALEFHVQDFARRSGMRYEADLHPVSTSELSATTAVFRIFQELLTNVARHAKASRVKVHLSETASHLLLKVEDNGVGLAAEDLRQSKKFGLLGMRERAIMLGGEIEIRGSPRSGTSVTLQVPLSTLRRPAPEAAAVS